VTPTLKSAAWLAVVLAAAGCDGKGEFRPLAVGQPIRAYSVETLAGDTVRLGGPGRVTVLSVWATWCTSCREEMADLNALQQEFAPHGVQVLAVSVDAGDRSRVQRFAEEEKLTFTVAHDPEARVEQAFQLTGVPETFVVGKDGRLLWRHIGSVHAVVDSVRAALAGAVTGS
jgi:cytochrome c biogenesis protein CcmG/thiol:disulfide interchange protein DsbE